MRNGAAFNARLVVLKDEVSLAYEWQVLEFCVEALVEGITLAVQAVQFGHLEVLDVLFVLRDVLSEHLVEVVEFLHVYAHKAA
ncbi:hypothetical protein FGO68_gene1852 [Halteria grandinella]|uniref:Uncharacterized protein n=1 Tax=Halteria grandinella TaxID=5974 RepID=A0A8J8NWZ9_HALGN|nr:hypothetical protein FGO68_gene1852 [Halteria grandinella]